MKVKHALILLVLGLLALVVGALFKISHWAGADYLIMAALALEAGGILLLVFKLLTRPGARRFLNT